MPTLKQFLDLGHMPKEAPTPFGASSFGSLAGAPPAALNAKAATSEPVRHMLARPGHTARPLTIPNPHTHFRLSQELVNEWPTVSAAIGQASMSATTPVDDPLGRRAIVPRESLDRTEHRAEMRATARYVLIADISQCYSSIYTHSIAWALHGKHTAKSRRSDMALLGNRLDKAVQSGQDGQTLGIPVGPDTSLAIAELILAKVDAELEQVHVKGFRYIDDYELYFRSHDEAQRGLSILVRALDAWGLALNPYKTRIEVLPVPLQDEWLSQLRRTELRGAPQQERSDLTILFDDAFRLAAANPGKYVVSYALGRLGSRIDDGESLVQLSNWPYLQRLLLQACWSQPTAIQKALSLFAWGSRAGFPLEKDLITESLNALVIEHAQLGNSSEVAWALWAALALGIRVGARAAGFITGYDDDIVALLALHLRSRRLLPRGLDVTKWTASLTTQGLSGSNWLLSYEASVQGWLAGPGGDHIAGHAIFSALRSAGVKFYDRKAQVPPSPPRVVLSKTLGHGPYG